MDSRYQRYHTHTCCSAQRNKIENFRELETMGFPLYVTCRLSLAAFNILSLCLVFVSLISMCLDMFLLRFIQNGTLWASWTWLTISFSVLGKFSTIISSKIFLYPFFFWNPYNLNVGAFDIVPEVSETILTSFHSFLLYSALQKLFPPFYPPAHWFILLLQIFCCWLLPWWLRR